MSHGFKIWLGVVVCVFNLSIWKAEADRSLKVQGQPGLYNEFLANQGYKVRPYLKKQKKLNYLKAFCIEYLLSIFVRFSPKLM